MLKSDLIIQSVITIGAGIASEMEVRELNELLNYLNNYAKNRKNKHKERCEHNSADVKTIDYVHDD